VLTRSFDREGIAPPTSSGSSNLPSSASRKELGSVKRPAAALLPRSSFSCTGTSFVAPRPRPRPPEEDEEEDRHRTALHAQQPPQQVPQLEERCDARRAPIVNIVHLDFATTEPSTHLPYRSPYKLLLSSRLRDIRSRTTHDTDGGPTMTAIGPANSLYFNQQPP
jgi:hypothetical protein